MKTTNITLADIYVRKAVDMLMDCEYKHDKAGMEYWHDRILRLTREKKEKNDTVRLKQEAIT